MSIHDIFSKLNDDDKELDIADCLSFENIKHQFNSKMVKELLIEFDKLDAIEAITKEDYKGTRITEIVKEHMGINVTMQWSNGYDAYIKFSELSLGAKSPLLYDYYRVNPNKNGARIIRNKATSKITVNIVTGYITGLEDVHHNIHVGGGFFYDPTIDSEMSLSVFLHELGHIWTYYLLMPHAIVTNFLAGEYSERFLEIESKEARMVFLKETEKELGMDILEKEKLSMSNDARDVGLILFTSHVQKLKSITGLNPYDVRNAEALADQFVVRLGLGRAQAKLDMQTVEATRVGVLQRVFDAIVTAPFIATLSPLLVIISALSEYSMIEEIYDNPVRRVEVTIQGMRNRYKEAPPRERRALMDELDEVEKYLRDNKDWMGPLSFFMAKMLPWGRSKTAQVNFQKALEDLSNNTLTTRADKLREFI